jgi:hypothetical protein
MFYAILFMEIASLGVVKMNRKEKTAVFYITIIVIMSRMTIPVYANASWDYVITRPVTLLPFVIIATLLIETYGIKKSNSINKTGKVFLAVFIGNFVSFVVPQISNILYVMRFTETLNYSKEPLYTIALLYYLLTILFEVPICYFMLKNKVSNKKRLIVSILLVNLITTVLVFASERTYMLLWKSYL